ncbi:MAG: DUF2318 domain-containing protein [Deltaproteobacteria bacterium]|nr:DUF2318 domain-containing protein [Deltaproteobacteria bacterium]
MSQTSGAPGGPESTDQKKAAVLGNAGSKKTGVNKTLLVALVIVALGIGGVVVWRLKASPKVAPLTAVTGNVITPEEMTFPVTEFADGKVRHFAHKTKDGLTIRFFVIKGSDGMLHTAFDACEVCWRAGLGYSQDGPDMICNKCGMRFPVDKLNTEKGGCHPVSLKSTIADGRLIIKTADMEAGRKYFDLPKTEAK